MKITVEQAKEVLKEAGYFANAFWSIEDIKESIRDNQEWSGYEDIAEVIINKFTNSDILKIKENCEEINDRHGDPYSWEMIDEQVAEYAQEKGWDILFTDLLTEAENN
jgi:hypothetical protein